MAKSNLAKIVQAMADGVTEGYQKIESGVVNGYQKVERGAVEGFTKVEDAFVDHFFTRDGETVEQARQRLSQEARQNKHHP